MFRRNAVKTQTTKTKTPIPTPPDFISLTKTKTTFSDSLRLSPRWTFCFGKHCKTNQRDEPLKSPPPPPPPPPQQHPGLRLRAPVLCCSDPLPEDTLLLLRNQPRTVRLLHTAASGVHQQDAYSSRLLPLSTGSASMASQGLQINWTLVCSIEGNNPNEIQLALTTIILIGCDKPFRDLHGTHHEEWELKPSNHMSPTPNFPPYSCQPCRPRMTLWT